MKHTFTLLMLLLLSAHAGFSQNILDSTGLGASSPSAIAFSLRRLSSGYSGPAIRARRSSDNAEANISFDAACNLSATSTASFVSGISVSGTLGSAQAGTVTTGVGKTGLVTIRPNKTGTILVSNVSQNVTGTGTAFTTELVVGDRLYNAVNNVYMGTVGSITSNTALLLTNNATINTGTLINYKTSSASVTGTGTNFTAELLPGDRLFNTANVYLGTVAAIAGPTALTLNAVDAVAATAVNFKSTSATVSGTGTNFTGLTVGDLLISNNTTLGTIATITNATSLTLTSNAGAAVGGLPYKTAAGSMPFGTFFAGTSVFVNTWFDQSGNGRDAIQLKSANQPRIVTAGSLNTAGGRASMEFSSGLNSFLQTSAVASYLNNTAYTLSKVSAEASINPANQFPLSTTGGSGPANSVLHFGYRSSVLLTLAQLSHDHTFNATPGTQLEAHLAVKPSAANSQFYKNGVSLGTANNGIPSYLQNVGLVNIGNYTPLNWYYEGSVSEIIAFTAALSTADIALLNNNQIARYNINTSSWTGAVSTQWGDAGNWSTGVVPTISTPAIALIPSGRPLYPIINGTTQVNSVSIEAGATLTTTGTLQVAGTINNLGTCTASAGTVEYIGTAPQGIGLNAFTGNSVQQLTISNATGLSLYTNFAVAGNLNFASGKLSIANAALTIGGTVTNTISGGLIGGQNSILIVNSIANPVLNFDQTTPGTSNSLKGLTINSSGQSVSLANNLLMNNFSTTTFTTGKLAIGNNTLTIRGAVVNTVNEGLTGGAGSNVIMDGAVNATLSMDQTTPGSTNALSSLTVNTGAQTISLNRIINIASALNLSSGILADGGNQLVSTGTLTIGSGTFKLGSPSIATVWPSFSTHNISAAGTVEYASGLAQTVSAVPVYQHLSISGAGGANAAKSLTVNGVLNLSAANPSAIKGCLSMGADTLFMGALATTTGPGDVTGIVGRTTILPNVPYTMGHEFTSITFPNTGTLPTRMYMKISIGTAPTWQALAIKRTYDFIQTGGSGTKAVINSHYLDAELNGNTESKLVDFSNRFAGPILTEHGKSNYSTVQNWVGLSNVNVAFFSGLFGNLELSLDESTLTTLTWNGSTSTSWITATNWTPNGGPSTNTELIIPDSATTPNDPYLPATASNGSVTIEAGGLVNADPGAQLSLNNSGLAWSNSGTFNAGTSNISFTSANATINGTTSFNNVTIEAGAALLATTGSTMRIGGQMTNNGTWSTGLLDNTVEYNGANQTILIPNGSTGAYHSLIISGTGTKVLPAGSLQILGDLTVNGAISASGNTISMNGNIAQAINSASPLTLNNLTIANSIGSVTLNQNLSIANTLTFAAGKLSIGNHTLTLSGNVVNTSPDGITGGLTSNLVINGAASPTLSFDQTIPGTSNTLNDLTINSNTQVPLLGSDLEVAGTLLFTAGKLAINGRSLSLKGSVTNNVAGGLIGSSSSNLLISGTTSPVLSFNQSIAGTTNRLNNLSINSLNQAATLAAPLVVGGTIALTAGDIISTLANNLTILAGGGYTGGSDSSFIDGPLAINTSDVAPVVFPVGKMNIYRPVSVTPATTSAGSYRATYFAALPPAGTNGGGVSGIPTNEYWDIIKVSGPDARVTLNYTASNTWNAGSPTSADEIFVAHLSGGIWGRASNAGIPGNTGGGPTSITSNLLTTFSPFTFGFGQILVLPLKLTDFELSKGKHSVKLSWATVNEAALAGFGIERSADGLKFEQLGLVPAINLATTQLYKWLDDAPHTGSNFYRLKMTDKNGDFKYSTVKRIQMDGTGEIAVYPNPVADKTIKLNMGGRAQGTYGITISGMNGQSMLNATFHYDGAAGVHIIHADKQLPAGFYYLKISLPDGNTQTSKLLVE